MNKSLCPNTKTNQSIMIYQYNRRNPSRNKQRPCRLASMAGKVVRSEIRAARNERQDSSRYHNGAESGQAERGSNGFRLSRRGSNWMKTQFSMEVTS
jgi:hypothetical protein